MGGNPASTAALSGTFTPLISNHNARPTSATRLIAAFDPDWGAGLLGDKAHSMTFDNTKIRRLVPEFNPTIPFWQGAREIMAYYDEDPAHQVIDADADAMMDRIIAAYEAAWP